MKRPFVTSASRQYETDTREFRKVEWRRKTSQGSQDARNNTVNSWVFFLSYVSGLGASETSTLEMQWTQEKKALRRPAVSNQRPRKRITQQNTKHLGSNNPTPAK